MTSSVSFVEPPSTITYWRFSYPWSRIEVIARSMNLPWFRVGVMTESFGTAGLSGTALELARDLAGHLVRQGLDIGVDHDLDQFLELHVGLPAELLLGLRGIAEQRIDLGRTVVARVHLDVVAHLEACVRERDVEEFLHRMGLSGREHEVLRLVGLAHPPHALGVLLGIAPVAGRGEVAEVELVLEPGLDAGDRAGDLARHERLAAARRLGVGGGPGDGEHVAGRAG